MPGDLSEGRDALVGWLTAAYPGLNVDPKSPLEYPCVALCAVRARSGRVVERWEMIDATITVIKDDGTIVWEYRRLRVRPWWRALYRWVRRLFGRPLPGPEGRP